MLCLFMATKKIPKHNLDPKTSFLPIQGNDLEGACIKIALSLVIKHIS